MVKTLLRDTLYAKYAIRKVFQKGTFLMCLFEFVASIGDSFTRQMLRDLRWLFLRAKATALKLRIWLKRTVTSSRFVEQSF